jgi:translation initiation factor IF-3
MAHLQTGREIMDGFCEKLADVASVDKAPKMEGRSLIVILTKKKDS